MATLYKYGDYEYTDEEDAYTAAEVKQQLTQYFPELANATVRESEEDGVKVVTFVKQAGRKG